MKAGIERDRHIAEMRGEADNCIDCNVGWKCSQCGDYRFKPYSTDIVAAMELWEEMKEAGLVLELNYVGFNNCVLYEDETKLGTEEVILVGTGKTEADAISGAYEKWREGQ